MLEEDDDPLLGAAFGRRLGDDGYVARVRSAGGFPRAFASPEAKAAAMSEVASRLGIATPPQRADAPPVLALPAPRLPNRQDEDAQMPDCAAPARQLRPVAPIKQIARLKPAPVPPPPQISWLPLSQLVVDDAYQRALSHAGIRLIRRLVERWDWNMFKPLSVAATGGGLYEVIDGQHTAIAAATHGSIASLPCLVLSAETVAERSAAFVGINNDRVQLTPHALWRARVAAGDAAAGAVQSALDRSGAQLVAIFSSQSEPAPGSLSCVGTLSIIERQYGEDLLAEVLSIAVAARLAPIPAAVLRALADLRAEDRPPGKDRLIAALRTLGGPALLTQAAARRRDGRASSQGAAVMQLLLHQLDEA